jgi:L,D-transpeptidase ErfK/SrfK
MEYRQVPRRCPIGTTPYIVQPGDNFYKIAAKFNVIVGEIITANPGINPAALTVGQQICIPQRKPGVKFCPSQNYYVVAAGDTFYSIARRFNVTVEALQRENPDANPGAMFVGEVLCIPLAPSPVSITVNVARKTLTLYRAGQIVKTYPVATGKPETPTPLGNFRVIDKLVEPGGPYGNRWMGFSEKRYGIHGTNNPASIGKSASNGCIRMQNKDVIELFNMVPVGTTIRIVPS